MTLCTIRDAVLVAGFLATAGCGKEAPATFVGSAACAACHSVEASAWRPSQHGRAIQSATDTTVLAPFRGESFALSGETTTFARRGGDFIVTTAGPDGASADFRVTHTFGVAPLQQYLVELPGGWRQALSVVWDVRGARWYHLYPDSTPRAGDALHWTGYLQNWNNMCADCHATGVRKGYDAATRTYATTRAEDGVGCEACHGAGSAHVAWARSPAIHRLLWTKDGLTPRLDERHGASWSRSTRTSPPMRSRDRTSEREVETCARCHARRAQLDDAVTAANSLHDGFRVALLEPGLYWPDGQQRDEVYTWGSFLQSRMNAAGVTCSDCHDPHTQALRAAGNGVCTGCHEPSHYDAPAHHFHEAGTPGAACTACHMPTTTYMGVDARHDHSLRVPRPDRSVTLGVPNACDRCHADRGAAWAAAAIARHAPEGSKGAQVFAEAFAALERGDGQAAGAVLAIAADSTEPPLVRASALDRLVRAGAALDVPLLRSLAAHPDPVLRLGAAIAAGSLPDPALRADLLAPLLADARRSVRVEAAAGLLAVPDDLLPAADRESHAHAREEYLAVQRFGADRPESQVNLATALAARGDLPSARAAFAEAIRLDSTFIPAYVNLADAERAAGDEARAEAALRRALAVAPRSGVAAYALGLSLVRQQRRDEGVVMLGEALRREPANARFAYAYAVSLHDTGRPAEARRVLARALTDHPGDPMLRQAAAAYGMP